jgi:hypothetical protein
MHSEDEVGAGWVGEDNLEQKKCVKPYSWALFCSIPLFLAVKGVL